MSSLPREAVLTLENDLSIQDAENLRRTLLDALATEASVRVTNGTESHLDLSILQLLFAAQRTADRRGRELSFVLDVAEETRVLLRAAGWEPPAGTGPWGFPVAEPESAE